MEIKAPMDGQIVKIWLRLDVERFWYDGRTIDFLPRDDKPYQQVMAPAKGKVLSIDPLIIEIKKKTANYGRAQLLYDAPISPCVKIGDKVNEGDWLGTLNDAEQFSMTIITGEHPYCDEGTHVLGSETMFILN